MPHSPGDVRFTTRYDVDFEWPGSGVPFHVSAPLPEELTAVLDAITPAKRAGAKGARRPKPARR